MGVDPSAIWDFFKATSTTPKEVDNVRIAEVTRIEDGVVWVSIPGGEVETPTESTNADVKAGDAVTVEWRANKLYIMGNSSAPATSNRDVSEKLEPIVGGLDTATTMSSEAIASAQAAEKIAEEAAAAVGSTTEHFWHNENGAHVTDNDKDAFLAAEAEGFPDWQPDPDKSGYKPWYNVLLNSLGQVFRSANRWLASFTHSAIAFYDGLGNSASNIVARFGKDGAQIGYTSGDHITLNASGLGVYSGTSYSNVNGVDVNQTATDAATAKSDASSAKTTASTANTTANSALAISKAVYGTSSTAAATQAKVVACSGFTLFSGALITVTFSNASTYASGAVQLNVNSTGAKNVWIANAVTSATNQLLWGAGASITFRYDGTQYRVVGDPRSWYGKCAIAAATAAKTDASQVATGAVICKGATVSLDMTNDNTATAPTLNVAGTGAKAIYAGSGTTRPLTSNGLGWTAASTAEFVFDGAAWRIGDSAALTRAKAAQTAAANAQTSADNAATAAAEAQATANATKQNFWADTNGVHVSTQANTAAGTFNSLLNSTGLIFRKADKNLLSLTGSALNFYDGTANAAANITASFGASSVRIGKLANNTTNVFIDSSGMQIRANTTAQFRALINQNPTTWGDGYTGMSTPPIEGVVTLDSGSGLGVNVNGSWVFNGAVQFYGDTTFKGGVRSWGRFDLHGKVKDGTDTTLNIVSTYYGDKKKSSSTSDGETITIVDPNSSWSNGVLRTVTNGYADGHCVQLGGGGLTIVGGGEFAANFYGTKTFAANAEHLVLGSDNSVYLYTCGNTIAKRRQFLFSSNGSFTTPGDAISMKHPTIDLAQSDNGVSATTYPGIWATDKSGVIIWRLEGRVQANGATGFKLYARNKNSSGTVIGTKGLAYDLTKANVGTWTVDDNASFRNALGASSGVWPVSLGGTGGTSAVAARKNLLIATGTLASFSAAKGASTTKTVTLDRTMTTTNYAVFISTENKTEVAGWTKLSFATVSKSITEVTIRVYNDYTAAVNTGTIWVLAVGR